MATFLFFCIRCVAHVQWVGWVLLEGWWDDRRLFDSSSACDGAVLAPGVRALDTDMTGVSVDSTKGTDESMAPMGVLV